MKHLILSAVALSVVCPMPAEAREMAREDFTTAAESTVNGVVSVKSYATPRVRQQQSNSFFDDPFFEYFFGSPGRQQQPQQQEKPKQRQIGLGSGVIVSDEGYIVTNNHVIADAERLEVTLNDNRNYNATIVGADPTTDLALIKIEADSLHVIPMGDSEKLKVGEWVLAVGNPFGFTSSVTAGIVSAKARNISSSVGGRGNGGIESYIQTDAAVNSGNSGGALVNLDGELVGINAAIYSQTGTYAGCSFAIPTSIVTKVIKDLKEFGVVQRAFMGIQVTEVTPELIADKGIKGVNSGVYIAEVSDRSAAREAGLKEGDVIVGLNQYPVHNFAQLQEATTQFSPGDEVALTYVRNGKTCITQLTMRNSDGNTALVKAGSLTDLGCAFAAVSEAELKQLEISYGVKVVGLEEGRFKDAGIRDGFIILNINDKRMSTPDDIDRMYTSIIKGEGDKVMFIKGIYPTGKTAFYAVPLTD